MNGNGIQPTVELATTTPVYGRTPIFTCNNGCGCGYNTTSQFI